MSCNNSGFSTRDNTWSSKSDLKPSNWYPYPEMLENYCDGCNYVSQKLAYSGNLNPGPLSNQHATMMEGYQHMTKQGKYEQLSQTWKPQKPYTL